MTVHSPHRQPEEQFLQSQEQISLAVSLEIGRLVLFLLARGFPWHSQEAIPQPVSLAAVSDVAKAELKALDEAFPEIPKRTSPAA